MYAGKFLSLLLLLCGFSTSLAQVPYFEKDSAAVKIIPELSSDEPFDTAHPYKTRKDPYLYILSQHDIYDLFGYAEFNELAGFDFSHYHILGRQVCNQCDRVCRHQEGETNCHRNRCDKKWIWLKRENSRAFTLIPSATGLGHTGTSLPDGRVSFPADTVIMLNDDAGQAAWYTHSGGDCHARISFDVFTDNYYPVLLLRENNVYGGCRAGGFWDFTIRFNKQPLNLLPVKRRFLIENKRE